MPALLQGHDSVLMQCAIIRGVTAHTNLRSWEYQLLNILDSTKPSFRVACLRQPTLCKSGIISRGCVSGHDSMSLLVLHGLFRHQDLPGICRCLRPSA